LHKHLKTVSISHGKKCGPLVANFDKEKRLGIGSICLPSQLPSGNTGSAELTHGHFQTTSSPAAGVNMSSKLIELYGGNTGNSTRAAIALTEVGIQFTAKTLNLSAGDQRTSAYLSMNPSGKVPTLVDHNYTPTLVISQSNAIIQYADAAKPGHLSPRQAGPERYRVYDRFFYFVTDVIASSHAGFFLKKLGFQEAASPLEARAIENLLSAEAFLSEGYMAGDAFSMADIAAFTWAASVHDELPWEKLPRMRRWFETIQARPAIQAGLQVFKSS
jgi:GST-like protein